MEAKLYKMTMFDGNISGRGPGMEVREIFIPQISAIINERGAIFRATEPRIKTGLTDIEVPYEATIVIDTFLTKKDELEKVRKEIFSN